MGKSMFKGEISSLTKQADIDLLDRKILFLLSENARYSNTALAKTLLTSREVVAYRLKKLEEQDFLHGYFTLINTQRLGKQTHMIYLKLFNNKEKEKLLEKAQENPIVSRIKEVLGTFDIQLIYTTNTIEELDEALEELLTSFGNAINDYTILRIIEENFLGMDILLEEEQRRKLRVKETKGSSYQNHYLKRLKNNKPYELDEVDKTLLQELQLNAKQTIRNLAKTTNLSTTAVETRIKKLIQEQVIESMYPLFAIQRLGYQWYKVLFQVRDLQKEYFLEYLKTHDNVLWYMKLIGKWNYQFSVFAKNNQEFYEILEDIKRKFSEKIISYTTFMVLNQKKFKNKF